MEKIETESTNNELDPKMLGVKFNTEDFSAFIHYLRHKLKTDPTLRFNIIAEWVSAQKARSAKALLDQYATKFNIDSFTIRATRQQYEKGDVNAFESGVQWEEV